MTENEKKPKTIGIIGGMGPLAGAELHYRIIQKTPVQTDQEHISIVHISKSCEIGDRTEFLTGNSKLNPGIKISELIQEAKSLGAKIFAVPCNTAHNKAILKEYDCEGFVSILEATYKMIKKRGLKEVGFIGTQASLEHNLYADFLKNFDIQVRTLAPADNERFVHTAIYDKTFGIKSKGVNDQVFNLLKEGMEKIQDLPIILGCTELSLLNKDLEKYFDMIDPLDALADELIIKAKEN